MPEQLLHNVQSPSEYSVISQGSHSVLASVLRYPAGQHSQDAWADSFWYDPGAH